MNVSEQETEIEEEKAILNLLRSCGTNRYHEDSWSSSHGQQLPCLLPRVHAYPFDAFVAKVLTTLMRSATRIPLLSNWRHQQRLLHRWTGALLLAIGRS